MDDDGNDTNDLGGTLVAVSSALFIPCSNHFASTFSEPAGIRRLDIDCIMHGGAI